MKTPEGRLKDQIKNFLKTMNPPVHWRMPVTMGYGSPCLDFVCCIKGRFVSIETKAPGKAPTAQQLRTMKEISDSGGAAFWCSTFDGFLINMRLFGLLPEPSQAPRD